MNFEIAQEKIPFGALLHYQMQKRGHLCVGIDPHPALLDAWNLPDTPAGLEMFSLRLLDALGQSVAVFKPQSALFERMGSKGIAVLERTLRNIKEAGALSILDVKRSDIGSTMSAYADTYLSEGAPLSADSITLSPYLGYESLRPAIDLAHENGRGVFVLALTSNPEGAQVQLARNESGITVAQQIITNVLKDNCKNYSDYKLGSVGIVIGATIGEKLDESRHLLPESMAPILVPGLGAQGGTSAQLKALFGNALNQILPSSSREILYAGPSWNKLKNCFERHLDSVEAIIA